MDKEQIKLLREISDKYLKKLLDELAQNGFNGSFEFEYREENRLILNSLYSMSGHPALQG